MNPIELIIAIVRATPFLVAADYWQLIVEGVNLGTAIEADDFHLDVLATAVRLAAPGR